MKNNLPQFSQLSPSCIEAELTQRLQHNREALSELLKQPHFTWDNFMQPMESLNDTLEQFWSPIQHLNSVLNTPELRNAYNACLPKLSDYASELSHNQAYYKAIQSIATSPSYSTLSKAQRKVIENEIRDFKLAGIGLPLEQQKQFAALAKQLSQLTTKFEENVMDATQGWTKLITDEKELRGIPKHAVHAAANAPQKENKAGWLFTLETPSYLAVMTYAHSATLREEMYRAFVTRASDEGPNAGRWDNTPIMHDILKTRYEMAQLLNFQNYAERSLATKMVKDTSHVLNFLEQLTTASLDKAREEYNELISYAKNTLRMDTVNAWDIAYVSEKLRQERYAISQEDLRPYFPEYKVIDGLFAIAHRLFGITIKEQPDADTWHPDAHCYVISDRNGNIISYFYTDLYARNNKRGGAWMDECRVRRKTDNGNLQLPIAFITCNFNAPIGDDPALFTHEDVITLFHEFGHALQHMLTKVDQADVSGINGIPWDAVEIASQLLENWAWEKESITLISEHYQTKAPLPKTLFNKMIHAKNFQSALSMARQLEFSIFDFRLHLEFDPKKLRQVQETLDDVRQKIRVIPTPDFNRFQHSFSHIFAGGYAAGYYSYKWAEVMASDAFSLFKEKGIFDSATSKRFLTTFLESGGTEEPMNLFIAFRGREPDIQALLKDSGIIT